MSPEHGPRPRSAFIELLLLEWQRHIGTLLIAGALIALVLTYAIVRFGIPTDQWGAALLFLLMGLPLFSLPVLAISWGFSALGDEWRGHTHHLLLSLPVHGRTVLGAKVVAAGLGLGALSLFGGGIAWWRLLQQRGIEALALSPRQRLLLEALTPVSQLGLALLNFVSTLLVLFTAGLLAYVVGRTAHRFQGWVTGASFIGLLSTWALVPAESIARWLPSIGCRGGEPAGLCLFTPAQVMFDVLFIGLMWWVATTLWDRRVEA